MLHLLKWLTPAIAAAALVLVSIPTQVRADDTAATGSVTGTVVDGSGKGVAGVKVKVSKPHAKGEKPEAVGDPATTDSDGKFTIAAIPAGDYVVSAGSKGVGRGHAKVTVAAGSAASVAITLEAAKGGAPAGAPPATPTPPTPPSDSK